MKLDSKKQPRIADSFAFENKKNAFEGEDERYRGHISQEIQLSEYQSFFADVFIPIYDNRWIIIQGKDGCEPSIQAMGMGFSVILDQESLHVMYNEQMAYKGWRLIKEFVGIKQSLLLFETPCRICLVELIKTIDLEKTEVRIFLGNK